MHKYVKEGYKHGARVFSAVFNDMNSSNGHQMKQRRPCLNIRKQFLPVRVTEHWHRLPRDIVESHSLEILKSHLT